MNVEDYPLWHGFVPMEKFTDQLKPGKFLVSGKGVWVTDADGNDYLDARSGLMNAALGYSNERVLDAITTQARLLPAATLLSYEHPAAVTVEFARTLVEKLPDGLDRVRLGGSGSQMTETAALISRFARLASDEPERMEIIAMEGSYHGTGAGAGALSGYHDMHRQTGPLMPNVRHAPSSGDWAEAIERTAEEVGPERVTAVFVEGLTGKEEIKPTSDELHALRGFCTEKGIHLVVDEVISGVGRTGAFTRCEREGITPDMLVLSKGISSGYQPLGALGVTTAIFDATRPGTKEEEIPLGGTFDGNPIAAAAGLAVLQVLEEDDILGNVNRVGDRLLGALRALHAERLGGPPPDGLGLGIVFPLRDGSSAPWAASRTEALASACEEAGLLVSSSETDGSVWFYPPLCLTDTEADEIVDRFGRALEVVAAA